MKIPFRIFKQLQKSVFKMKSVYFLTALCALLFSTIIQIRATIVIIAPHPDDAEASCGGLIINAVASGEEVIILTMTGGELGIWGKSNQEALLIRTEEARKAAALLGAKVMFFGSVDASLAVDSVRTAQLKNILLQINPTSVYAPWPLDVHSDHQATGLLAWRVFQNQSSTFDLYFYETSNSPHTMTFQFVPTDYIDITDVIRKKQEALYQHKSQHPEEWFDMYETMARFRGYESDVTYAEGYIKARNSSGMGGRSAKARKSFNTKN
jgi:LmbE family N-acetylglucosaminyl deacetylase